MPFALLVAFIFALGIAGKKPSRATYIAIAIAALIAAVWEYLL